jgi:hypothetical protein
MTKDQLDKIQEAQDCNEVLYDRDGNKRAICKEKWGTEHSHYDGLDIIKHKLIS